MAYQDITTVNSKPTYQQTQVGVLGLGQKTVNYGTRYDPETGDYEVRAYEVKLDFQPDGTQKRVIKWQNDVLYSNGTWYRIATQDSFLFDQNTKNESIVATGIADQVKTQVKTAHAAAGGNAAGKSVHPSVNVTGQHSATNNKTYNPSTQPTIVLTGPAAAIANTGIGVSFVSRNERELFGDAAQKQGLLVYPATILKHKQDHIRITQFNYEAPYADALFPRVGSDGNRTIADPGKILVNGLQRGNIRTKKNRIGSVILPIPVGISDSNSATWGAEGMNNMSAAVMAMMMNNVANTAGGLAASSIMQALGGPNAMPLAVMIELFNKANAAGGLNDPGVQQQFRAAIASAAAQKAGFDISAENILSRGYGMIPNQNMELLFNNVQLREFNFGFDLAPRSRKEAKNVRRIIRFFKQGMAARIANPQTDPDAAITTAPAGSTSLFLGSPNVFHIEYIHGPSNEQIKGLTKFKTCALSNMTMNYAKGGMYQSFDDGQPAHMTMTLKFNELEPVYESDYQGNIRTGNELIVREDDIGY